MNDSVVGGIACTLFTGGFELFPSDAHLRNKFAQKLIDELEEILKRKRNGGGNISDNSEFKKKLTM